MGLFKVALATVLLGQGSLLGVSSDAPQGAESGMPCMTFEQDEMRLTFTPRGPRLVRLTVDVAGSSKLQIESVEYQLPVGPGETDLLPREGVRVPGDATPPFECMTALFPGAHVRAKVRLKARPKELWGIELPSLPDKLLGMPLPAFEHGPEERFVSGYVPTGIDETKR